MPNRLLKTFVVEDDPVLCRALASTLEADPHMKAVEAHDLPDAIRLCREEPQVVLLVDLGLPGASEVEAVTSLRHELPAATLVVVTERDDMRGPALGAGAHAVILKGSPESFGKGLVEEVRRAVIAHDVELLFRAAHDGLDKAEGKAKEAIKRASQIVTPLVLLWVGLDFLWTASRDVSAAESLRQQNAVTALREADPAAGSVGSRSVGL